jgi:CRP/FNR family transcriptional regulator
VSIKNSIRTLNFFHKLNKTQLDMLGSISTIDTYNENNILYYEKTKSTKLIFLVSGLAKAYKIDKHNNEIFLYYIPQNSMVSEISTLNDDRLNIYSNISFIESSQILSIDYKKFKTYFLDKNILTDEFINEIINRGKKLESLIDREFIFDAVAKVAMMLDFDLNMFNKIKRHDISLMLHIQPSTLSRVLNRLKRNEIIDITQGKVSILNHINLQSIYKELSNEWNKNSWSNNFYNINKFSISNKIY